MIKAKYDHIQDYSDEMQDRFFAIMSFLWRKSNCECGMFHRDIGNEEHRKLMNINNWGPANKGPRWHYDFDNNTLRMSGYWCHGCKKTFKKRLRHTDQWIVVGMYKLFKEHNPELIPELFTEENEHE